MARIYLASSWRNPWQPEVCKQLREWGHHVYDFRKDSRKQENVKAWDLGVKEPPATVFYWAEMDPDWQQWYPHEFTQKLQTSPRAAQGYVGDLRGMEWADTCVLCLPCGNSAHIEAGYMKGRGKRLIIYWHTDDRVVSSGPQGYLSDSKPAPEKTWTFEPDLMYLLADNLVTGLHDLRETLYPFAGSSSVVDDMK